MGPKRATVLNTLPLVLGTALSAPASSLGTMLLGRAGADAGAGAASVYAPRLVYEGPLGYGGAIQLSVCVAVNAHLGKKQRLHSSPLQSVLRHHFRASLQAFPPMFAMVV